MSEQANLAQLVQTYGGWGLSSILMMVCAFLFKKYVEARDKIDAILESQVKGTLDMVEDSTKAAVEQKNTNDNVTKALENVGKRLENVEKKFG